MKKDFFIFLIFIIIGTGMLIRTFFGGNGKNLVNNENTGFIEKLNNTGNNIQNDNTQNNTGLDIITTNTTNTQLEDTTPKYNKINVMIPKYFYATGRKAFEEDLYNNQNVEINFIFIDDLNLYKNLLANPNFSEADLFLFPYDRNGIVNTRKFSPKKNIEGLFDGLVSPIVKNKEIGFLPFSVDPMIMYSYTDLDQNNFSEISDLIYNRNPKIQLAFPIFFGITSEDYDNKGFLREYQDIVRYALLHYFKTYQDSKSLSIRINSNILENNDEIRNYNISDLNLISSMITQPECKYFPSICFQVYNFVGIRFGFLSDADIIQTYFSHKKSNFENTLKTTMPFSTIESPVRIWGWGISNNIESSNTENSIEKLFLQYINNHNKYNLRNSTLPIFKTDGDSLINNQYIGSRGYILETGGDYINSLRSVKAFRQLIEHQISSEDYLKKA